VALTQIHYRGDRTLQDNRQALKGVIIMKLRII